MNASRIDVVKNPVQTESAFWKVSGMHNHCINQLFGAEGQIDMLLQDYLIPIGDQLDGVEREAYDAWLPTIRYE